MSKPIVSISVPEKDQASFKRLLPAILSHTGTPDKPMKLSRLVQEVVLHGLVFDKKMLQEFTSKEAFTSRDKYLVVILG